MAIVLAVHYLRTLLNLVMTNSEVRKLLSDFGFIGRDLLAKAVDHVAGAIRPTQEQISNVDESGPQDKFVTAGGREVGQEETPVLEARVPGTDTTVSHDPNEPEPQVSSNGQVKGTGEAFDEQKDKVKESSLEQVSDAQRYVIICCYIGWLLT
jgi:hypothetical protein